MGVSKAQVCKPGSLLPISPATLAPASRRLELLVASAEAVGGGKSVGISVKVLGSVAFLGYKVGLSLKTFRHGFIQRIPGGGTLAGGCRCLFGGVGWCSLPS